MQLTEFIGLLGLLAVPYAGFVHSRLAKVEEEDSNLREQILVLREHVNDNYLRQTVGKELQDAVQDIREMIGHMNTKLEVLFDRQDRAARNDRSD